MATASTGRVMPIISVASVDATRQFYVETLGFQHLMAMVGKDGQLDFCTVTMGSASLMFNRAAEPGAPGKQPVEIYLEVPDVEGLHATLARKGVAISEPLLQQWWGDLTFKVLDPNGYVIWFYTNVAEPVAPAGAKLI